MFFIFILLQIVDMRWGVPEQAADNHATTDLCIHEIQKCQEVSAGPTFVVSIKMWFCLKFSIKVAVNRSYIFKRLGQFSTVYQQFIFVAHTEDICL